MFARWTRRRVRQAVPDPSLATQDDILACFRLLLGRAPNPEEWRGHSAQAGQDLSRVVASYLNSLEFARRGLLAPGSAGPPQLAAFDGFRLFASPDDLLIGRHVLAGQYEPEVEAVFRETLRPGMAVIDIGANIGFFTMLAASLVGPQGAVLAVEPNPDNARLIEASRRLNGFGHVTTAALAAGRTTGLLVLNTSHSNGTTSEPADDPRTLLGARAVPCLAVDALVAATWTGRGVGLIKVDVEGAEYNALLGAAGIIARDRPSIVSEFSPAAMPGISGVTGPEYLAWLHRQGYALSVIQPEGPPLDAGQDSGAVMDEYERRGVDHIDLLARPV